MKVAFFICLLVSTSIISYGQKPKDGLYTYKIAFEEWEQKSLGATCTVEVKGDSIKIIHNGTKSLTGNKGDIFDQGILMIHTKTGKWIVGHAASDKDANEIGGCSNGPLVIDFKKKIVWFC